MKVLEKLGWKPPSSKDSGITDADTLFNETTIKHVKKFYDEEIRFVIAKSDGSDIQTADHRVAVMGPGKVSLPTKLKHAIYHSGVPRLEDPKYNDKDAPLQIHCFGDSWTYGWDVKQEESFPHLLGCLLYTSPSPRDS